MNTTKIKSVNQQISNILIFIIMEKSKYSIASICDVLFWIEFVLLVGLIILRIWTDAWWVGNAILTDIVCFLSTLVVASIDNLNHHK